MAKNYREKIMVLKETLDHIYEMSEEITLETAIEEAIAFLIEDEEYSHQGSEQELRAIYNSIDMELVKQCSCCKITILPDEECYSDSLNNGAALCDACAVFNEETDMYERGISRNLFDITKMGENRIEFLSQLEEVEVGGLEVNEKNLFKDLSLNEKIYYLQAIIEDLEDYKKL